MVQRSHTDVCRQCVHFTNVRADADAGAGWLAGSPRVSIDGKPPLKFPLDINNLLLRGSVLRKTGWVIGMAINVGSDSKIVQNMTKAPRKVCEGRRLQPASRPASQCAHPVACLAGIDTLSVVAGCLLAAVVVMTKVNSLAHTGTCTALQGDWCACGWQPLVGNSGLSAKPGCCLLMQVTQLERAMNVLVFVQFTALLVFSAVLAGLDQYWTKANISAKWYLQSLDKWPELPPGPLGWLVSVGAWLAACLCVPLACLREQQTCGLPVAAPCVLS